MNALVDFLGAVVWTTIAIAVIGTALGLLYEKKQKETNKH